MHITEILRTNAETYAATPAILDTRRGHSRALSFAELEQASAQTAACLWQQGLRPGDTALIFQPMSAELYILLLAAFRLGLVAMFLDPAQGKTHLDQCCVLHPPQALIASPKAHLLRFLSPALRRIPHKFIITEGGKLLNLKTLFQSKIQSQRPPAGNPKSKIDDIASKTLFQSKIQNPAGGTLPEARKRAKSKIDNIASKTLFQSKIQNPKSKIEHAVSNSPETPALLTFTGGSTGQPKAVVRTHGFLLTQHQVLAESLGLQAGQLDLTTMPIVALANLASGVTCLIPDADLRYPGVINPAPIVAQIQAHRIGSTVASPALLERLAHYCLQHHLTLPSLTKVFTGGAPVFPRLLDQLQPVMPNAELVAVYGSTEAEPIAKLAYDQLQPADRQAMRAGQGLLAGHPVPAIHLRILPDRWGTPLGPYTEAGFAALCCSPTVAGEIVVSGAHVLSGYLHGQGDQETKFKVNETIWHRTGDAGYLDQQGRLWLLGRCAARIDDEHGTLYPFAVECAISHQPELRRAALVAHEGRRLLAVEFYNHTFRPDLASLKSTLAWAHLEEVRVCRHIPVDKRHNAKVDYPALHKLMASR